MSESIEVRDEHGNPLNPPITGAVTGNVFWVNGIRLAEACGARLELHREGALEPGGWGHAHLHLGAKAEGSPTPLSERAVERLAEVVAECEIGKAEGGE